MFTFVASASAEAASLSTGYASEQDLPFGTVVSVDSENQNFVEPTTLSTLRSVIGVIVRPEEATLNIAPNATTVQVASDGVANVLVSDLNGEIMPGDLIAPSSIAGVAAKWTDQGVALGTAQAVFNRESSGQLTTAQGEDGSSDEVYVGTILVTINISEQLTTGSDLLPEFLRSIIADIAGKELSIARSVAVIIVFLLTLIGTIVLVYGAVRSAIISIGRNPLSRGSVYLSLVQVFVIVFLVLATGAGVIFVLLRF